jgi:hypothetical protein
VLDVQTASFSGNEDAEPAGATNYGALRVKRNLGRRSSVGAIVTRKDEAGADANQVVGVDVDFNPSDRFNVNAFAASTQDDSLEGDDWAAGAGASYRDREWEASLDVIQISEAFDPGIGFLQRDDIRRFKPKIEFSPIFNRHGIRNWNFQLESEYITTTDGLLESRENQLTLFGLRSLRGDFVGINLTETSERLFEEFEISEGVMLAPGRYDFDPEWSLFVSSSESRPLSARVNTSTGGFWTGDRDSASLTLTARPNRHLRSETSANLNRVSLPEGSFDSNVYRQRLSVAITPEYLLNGLLQYNEGEEELGLNLRFNWIYSPGAIKYWFSITDEEQQMRFLMRIHDPLKQWKLSPMDLQSRVRWEAYTKAKEDMFARTNIAEAPWHIVEGNDKKRARLNCIDHFLMQIPYAPVPHEHAELPERVFNPKYERRVLPQELYVPSKY